MIAFARRYTAKLALMVLATLVAVGCQTTPKSDEGRRMMPPPRIPFQPYSVQASVRVAEGRYPNLFTGTSHAVWENALPDAAMMSKETATTEAKMEAIEQGEDPAAAETKALEDARMRAATPSGPIEITCYLESQFPDMSVAYDVVGLRGLEFHLELPDGRQLMPIQKTLDPELSETPVGALRRYGRKVRLYFPAQVIVVDNPAVSGPGKGVRLVLEGHESQFYFEWPARPDVRASAKKPLPTREVMAFSRRAYQGVARRAKNISHEFD